MVATILNTVGGWFEVVSEVSEVSERFVDISLRQLPHLAILESIFARELFRPDRRGETRFTGYSFCRHVAFSPVTVPSSASVLHRLLGWLLHILTGLGISPCNYCLFACDSPLRAPLSEGMGPAKSTPCHHDTSGKFNCLAASRSAQRDNRERSTRCEVLFVCSRGLRGLLDLDTYCLYSLHHP